MDMGRNFHVEKVIKYWNGMPRDAVESLEVFKERLDVALSAIIDKAGGVWSQVDLRSFPT